MKDLKKAAVTAVTIAAMAASTLVMPVSASSGTPEWNTQGGQETVDGDTYLISPVIEVELPGDLTFGVNPLKMDVSEDPAKPQKDQIISGTYMVTNYSEVPVAVSAATKVTASNDVQLVAPATGTTWPNGTWNTTNKTELKAVDGKKAVLLVQMYPTKINSDGTMTTDTLIKSGSTPAPNSPNAVKGDILTTAAPTKSVCFVLNAFNEEKANESMGGFEFDGAVDPNAVFKEGDLAVDTVYTMDIITEEQKANTSKYNLYTTNTGFKGTSTTMAGTIKEEK